MALNSIDFVTMLPRTVEAAEIQGKEMNQLQHATDQVANQFQGKIAQEARQTVESQKSDAEEYDLNGSGGKQMADERNRNKKKKKETEAPIAPRSTSSFDIMI